MTEAFWVAVSAVASAAVAIATGFLAKYTYDLAKETRQALVDERTARRAEERRHMDEFMPHIALIVEVKLLELFGVGIKQRFVALYAKNIGPGFAQNIRAVHSNAPAQHVWIGQMPTGLASGSELLLAANEYSNVASFLGYTITYEDAFGREFESHIADNIVAWPRFRGHHDRPQWEAGKNGGSWESNGGNTRGSLRWRPSAA